MNNIYKELLKYPHELEFTVETNIGKQSLNLSQLVNSGFIYSDSKTYLKSAEKFLNRNNEDINVTKINFEDFRSYHISESEDPDNFDIYEYLSIHEEIYNKISKIAKEELYIKTLKTRGSDSLDFHDTAVWALEDALTKAYLQGIETNELELTEDSSKKMKM